MRAADPKVTVTGTYLGESAKAIQFNITQIGSTPLDKPITTWFPFSQIEKIYKSPKEIGKDYLVVSEWILIQKDLLDEYSESDFQE